MCPILSYQNIATLTPVYFSSYFLAGKKITLRDDVQKSYLSGRLTCAWQYFGTLIFELFFEIIRSSVDKINFLFLC